MTSKQQVSKHRIAIIDDQKCKPKKCRQECKRNCPVVRLGKLCIEVTSTDKIATLSETLCIGCGICVRKCPFNAITIINLPSNLENSAIHRYGPNSFVLHRLPMPRKNEILGLVGANGTGKSTALKILAGKIQPNLGRWIDPPDHKELQQFFRGTDLQNYFDQTLSVRIKPQYVDHIAVAVGEKKVQQFLQQKDERKLFDQIVKILELENILSRNVKNLSGGELQRFAIAYLCIQNVDVYMFDEPSSYLDIKQRMIMANTIRKYCTTKYCVVVEHDLSILDYLSDFVCCLYGRPSVYSVVTMPYGVREGINVFLAGFIPTENMRFRDVELTFKIAETIQEDEKNGKNVERTYPDMSAKLGQFELTIQSGSFNRSEIIVMLGQNGTGKTTFIRMLAKLENITVSYKPQEIHPTFPGTVQQLLQTKIPHSYVHPQFITDVIKPLRMEDLYDLEVKKLSGGELQRTAITLALGKPADVYLIDEPSAYLDSEQRIIVARVLKRFITHTKKSAFIVEHDFIMATYLADRVIVFEGHPAIKAVAQSPQSLLTGMNSFLSSMEVTFRRDPTNHRPRINKLGSVKDQQQKKSGTYFFVGDDEEED